MSELKLEKNALTIVVKIILIAEKDISVYAMILKKRCSL
jgi:hypothetical protein